MQYMVLNSSVLCQKFATQIMYPIPKYYVPQVLSEMHALNCNDLLFLCWSEETSTVIEVKNDEDLWNEMKDKLQLIYGNDHPRRPTRLCPDIKNLKQKIENFVVTHTRLIAEVKSVKASPCVHSDEPNRKYSPLYKHGASNSGLDENICSLETTLQELMEIIHFAKKSISEAHQLCRKLASEIFAFIISDVDRIKVDDTQQYYFPIAYGLKSYSLSVETVRKIMKHLLLCCKRKGIYIPITAFDGQWAKLVIRDENDEPLTKLKFQKDHFKKCFNMTK